MKLPAAQILDRRVNGGASEVGGWQRKLLDVSALGEYPEEDGLQNVLGVGRISGDAQGRAEYRFVMALVNSSANPATSAYLTLTHENAAYYMGCEKLQRQPLDARFRRLSAILNASSLISDP